MHLANDAVTYGAKAIYPKWFLPYGYKLNCRRLKCFFFQVIFYRSNIGKILMLELLNKVLSSTKIESKYTNI